MINANGAFIRSFNYSDIALNRVKCLYVFTGVPPTKAEIAALAAADSNNEVRIEDLISWAAGQGQTLLQANFYNGLSPVYSGDKVTNWPLAERTEEFIHLADGAIGWFFFGGIKTSNGRSTFEGNPSGVSSPMYFTYIGDAGDENASSDLGLLTGLVASGKEYSSTDLRFGYV